MRIKLLGSLLIAAVALTQATATHAARANTYYDAKSNIIGVSGDVNALQNRVGSGKIENNAISKNILLTVPAPEEKNKFSNNQIQAAVYQLNRQNVGKAVLDYLLMYSGSRLSEDRLRERAGRNVTMGDIERANEALLATGGNAAEILKEDVLPILTHNYLYFETPLQGNKFAYMIFHVDITKKTMDDVYMNWENMSAYNQIQPAVSYVTGGVCENDETSSKFQSQLAANAADFAIRGQLITRSRANITPQDGARVGDRIVIYRQQMDKDGNFYSKRIARARLSGWDGDKAHFFRIAGNAGNAKNGDMAVISRDKRWSTGIEGVYQPHLYGFSITGDHSGSFHKSGFYNHFIFEIGMAITDKPDANWAYENVNGGYGQSDETIRYKAPVFFNLGFGYGLSKTFVGLFELMPYFVVQADYAYCLNDKTFSGSGYEGNRDGLGGLAVRIPVGLRFSINIAYPFQFTAAAGYAFRFGINGDNQNFNYETIQDMLDNNDTNRQGLFVQAGFRWHF